MIREKENVVNNFLAFVEVAIAWLAFNMSLFLYFGHFSFLRYKDSIILHLIIALVWFTLGKYFRLAQLHRSRPYSALLFNCVALVLAGTSLLGLAVLVFDLYYIGFDPLIYFGFINLALMFGFKIAIYAFLKRARVHGRNSRSIIIIGDYTAASFIEQVLKYKEWGYKIVSIIGNQDLSRLYGELIPVLSPETDVAKLLEDKTIDEVIFIKGKMSIDEVEHVTHACSEVGVIFRMYSPFFNKLKSKAHIHHYNTMPLLTIANTPTDYLAMRLKAIFDFVFSLLVIVVASPVFVLISALIALTDRGPVFFKQKRVGLRGRKFYAYKFRTMVVNAEELKSKLLEDNEMDGPVFKMKNDPRITKIGRFLRKTSLDELPQFFNVLLGDMSIVGPRPPVPQEVKEYERWQLRRLSMKPGITCTWQSQVEMIFHLMNG
ncbi:putative colanic biosynthesis UDP-glucose lipid carrier transferase [Saccharicrinis fermentans DSM 9555 = JCM 21142]|uniref:Putative colanic biosynthesis UDP-glucose lipid carrier transferase n=1 Tax=Saccharicrinis fermentans DSM 9555 = JCM 21142 TaxID=869213 RepID=W7XVC1_9BACT|nr:putative colanic biosynthesis UDP-glucose lipid carrier transferase [Saccharicrinis fermentans DSM 9555 = JCM 21142]